MSAPTLRAATAADEERVRALVFAVLDEYEIEPAPKTADRDLYDLEGFYADGMFAVLETADGEIIGTVGIAPLGDGDDGVCELRKMYLMPKFRGRGLGARLLKHAIAQARSLGFSRIDLNTKRIMEEAVGIYLKFGFVPVEGSPSDRRSDQILALHLEEAY